MTLITRLHDYLYERLKVVKENMHGYKETNFNLNNANYELDVSIRALEEMDSKEIDEHNTRVYERIEETYKIISRMYHSDFMRIMSRYQKVKAPIMKTQIILKNPDFRSAYLLWIYLDRLHVLDFTLETKVKNKRFNKNYHEQLNQSLLLLFSTVFTNSSLGSTNASEEELNIRSLKPRKDLNAKNSTVNRNRRIANNKAIKQINDRYKEQLKVFREKEKLRLENERKKIKEKRLKELERAKVKAQKEREKEALRLKNLKLAAQKKNIEKLKEQKAKIKKAKEV